MIPTWMYLVFGVVGGLVILLLMFLGYMYFFRRKKQYPFLLYSRDLKRRKVIYAVLKTDPNNKENKKFFFQGMDTQLPLKEPTAFQNNVAYREVIQNKAGGYSYIEGTKLDEKDYLELSLSPDEKSLALHRIKENEDRNSNPMSKTQAAMLITGFILIIILVIGIIYSTIAYVGAAKNLVKLAEQTKAIQASAGANLQIMNTITEQQARITAMLTGDKNITRTVS